MPLFSIITVTYNPGKLIEKSIKSVLQQTCRDYEYIIIDGKSTDGTVDRIQQYKSGITHFISEKDNGIYDAMNKGIELSKGDYILFLGADDFIYDESTLARIADLIQDKALDLIIGNVLYTSGKVFKSVFNFKTLLNNTIHHQGTLYHKSLFNQFRFDLNFSLIADYELNLKLYRQRDNLKYLVINDFVSICTDGGVSRSQIKKGHDETNAVRKKILGSKAIFFRCIYEVKFFVTTKVLS